MNDVRQDGLAMLLAADDMFRRSASALTESDSAFRPAEGMFSVAEQVAHAAQTVDWFREGAFSPTGYDFDFEKHGREIAAVTSLASAWTWWERAVERMRSSLEEQDEGAWNERIVPGPAFGGEPRWKVLRGVVEHTAHHRGALTVYTRLLGREPPMPYGDPA